MGAGAGAGKWQPARRDAEMRAGHHSSFTGQGTPGRPGKGIGRLAPSSAGDAQGVGLRPGRQRRALATAAMHVPMQIKQCAAGIAFSQVRASARWPLNSAPQTWWPSQTALTNHGPAKKIKPPRAGKADSSVTIRQAQSTGRARNKTTMATTAPSAPSTRPPRKSSAPAPIVQVLIALDTQACEAYQAKARSTARAAKLSGPPDSRQ
jgi:hypothetical protein